MLMRDPRTSSMHCVQCGRKPIWRIRIPRPLTIIDSQVTFSKPTLLIYYCKIHEKNMMDRIQLLRKNIPQSNRNVKITIEEKSLDGTWKVTNR